MSKEGWVGKAIWAIIGGLLSVVGAYLLVVFTDLVGTQAELVCHIDLPPPVGNGITVLVSAHPDGLFKDFNLWFRTVDADKDLMGIKIVPTCTRPNSSPEKWNDEMTHNDAKAAAWGTVTPHGLTLYTQRAGSKNYHVFDDEKSGQILYDIVLLKNPEVPPTASPNILREKGTTQAVFDGMLSREAPQRHASRQQAIALGPEAIPALMSWARGQKKTYDLALGTAYVISSLIRNGQSDTLKQFLSDDDKTFLRSLQSVSNDPTLQQQITGLKPLLG
jgi:hypothetical protein